MDNESSKWTNDLLEITLAVNTQKDSTFEFAISNLLFRERTSSVDRLDGRKRRELAIGISQEGSSKERICVFSL